MTELLKIKHAIKDIQNGSAESVRILNDVNLTISQGDFVTILGGNGAGKSTLFNSIAGTLKLTQGNISIEDTEITNWSEEKRAIFMSRVFQDPKMGTAPRMTVAENLLLALKRGQKRTLIPRKLFHHEKEFFNLCLAAGNGLEQHLNTPTGQLSGGQRQALSLLMATITKPKLLLLDEHTAALDPKTSRQVMEFTNQTVEEQQLTCLMITHRMEDALKYGNRLILLKKGQVALDLNKDEKAELNLTDLLKFFEDE